MMSDQIHWYVMQHQVCRIFPFLITSIPNHFHFWISIMYWQLAESFFSIPSLTFPPDSDPADNIGTPLTTSHVCSEFEELGIIPLLTGECLTTLSSSRLQLSSVYAWLAFTYSSALLCFPPPLLMRCPLVLQAPPSYVLPIFPPSLWQAQYIPSL